MQEGGQPVNWEGMSLYQCALRFDDYLRQVERVFEYLELDYLPVVDIHHCYPADDQWVRIDGQWCLVQVQNVPIVGGAQGAGAHLAEIPNYPVNYRRVVFADVDPTDDDDQVIGVFEWTDTN
jgi:hypothetical protein